MPGKLLSPLGRLAAALAARPPALAFGADAAVPNKGDTAWMLTATALVRLPSSAFAS